MKLSTAIRIGSMTTKQIKGAVNDGGNGRCAIGAAIDATGNEPGCTAWHSQITTFFPLAGLEVKMPPHECSLCTECRYVPVFHVLYHLNDTANWTREAIADWVESVENALEEKEGNKQGNSELNRVITTNKELAEVA